MEEIPNNQLGCIKPCKWCDKPPINDQLVQDFFHQLYYTVYYMKIKHVGTSKGFLKPTTESPSGRERAHNLLELHHVCTYIE